MTEPTFTMIPACLTPSCNLRRRVLVDNPATPYGFSN